MDAEHKTMVTIWLLVKDPALWLVTVGAGAVGLVAEVPGDWKSHSGTLMVLAFFGGLVAKLLQFWLRMREQRNKLEEDQADRMERILDQERADHREEVLRLNKRIQQLEARLDGRADKV